jgi:hypothetical protein
MSASEDSKESDDLGETNSGDVRTSTEVMSAKW